MIRRRCPGISDRALARAGRHVLGDPDLVVGDSDDVRLAARPPAVDAVDGDLLSLVLWDAPR